MTDRITQTDLDAALAAHVETLERCGISYVGRLAITSGSKTYGIAFRLYRTGYLVPSETGTGYRPTTRHASPPIGSDYLGMTRREAYETLTTRTAVIADVSYALKNGSE